MREKDLSRETLVWGKSQTRPISKDKAIVKIEHESNYNTSTYSTKLMFSYLQWIEYLKLATLTYIGNLVGMCV